MEYKSKWNGRGYVKTDTFYAGSQMCSACGYQNEDTKDLSVREWRGGDKFETDFRRRI